MSDQAQRPWVNFALFWLVRFTDALIHIGHSMTNLMAGEERPWVSHFDPAVPLTFDIHVSLGVLQPQ